MKNITIMTVTYPLQYMSVILLQGLNLLSSSPQALFSIPQYSTHIFLSISPSELLYSCIRHCIWDINYPIASSCLMTWVIPHG